MRPDMSKVVTERPRSGSRHAPSLKTGATIHRDQYDADDHGPTRHPVSAHRQHGWDAKEFSDLIGPLRKYLYKQVGRPWDKIYSELSANLDKRSLSGRHIWTHVLQEVQTHVMEINGQCYEKPRQYSSGVLHTVAGLYVHPRTRLLRSAPLRSYKHTKPIDPNVHVLDDTHSLQRIKGIWFLLTRIETHATVRVFNPTTRTYATTEQQTVTFNKRQLSKHQLKTYAKKVTFS